jgi:hypothetical protein
MNAWFRVYNTLVDDPKVRRLPDNLVASLLFLWCIAGENEGVLPPIEDVAFKLRCAPAKAAEIITKLCRAGLFDNDKGVFRPHNWGSRQYKSDGSAERMRRHRGKGRDVTGDGVGDVTVTVPVTGPEQSRTDTEQSRAEQTRAAVVSYETKGEQSDIIVRVLKTDLMEAFGEKRCPDLTRASNWIALGYAPSMCTEVVRELLARKPDINSLAYFDAALEDRHAKRAETPSERAASERALDMDKAVARFAKARQWSRYAGPEPGQIGCRASVEMLAKHGLDPSGEKLRASA